MENNSSKYERRNFYISAFSVVISVIAGVIYVAVSLAKMETKIEMLDRLTRLEDKLEYYENDRNLKNLRLD